MLNKSDPQKQESSIFSDMWNLGKHQKVSTGHVKGKGEIVRMEDENQE